MGGGLDKKASETRSSNVSGDDTEPSSNKAAEIRAGGEVHEKGSTGNDEKKTNELFEVTVGEGNLGIKLAKVTKPGSSGVLKISKISPSGLIAQNNPNISNGFILAYVNNVDCRELEAKKIMKTITSAKKPITFKFLKPFNN